MRCTHVTGTGFAARRSTVSNAMEVISTRRYEARPAAAASVTANIDHENAVATVKEEEWETRKKKEITTTRQIETRVKRQVVLEDGEVVVDSGPVVTTNTTEDVEQQEHTTHERKTAGDEPKEIEWTEDRAGHESSGTPSILQKESNETVVRSREEIEERLETEDRQQLGDISDEVYLKAIQTNKGDLRAALAESSKQVVPVTGPRVVQHTTRSNKVTDTENKLQKSQIQADGRIITETKRTVEHEEVNDDEVPDDKEAVDYGDDEKEVRKEGSHRFLKQKDEELVDYVSGGERVAREMRFVSENTEGERTGDWPPVPTTMRTTRLHKHSGLPENVPISRKDALTKKPLDLEEEDEARKVETSKWLESHFGSESRSSHGSLDLDDPPVQTGTNTSFINVTMKSLPMSPSRDRDNGWDRNHLSTSYSSHQQTPTKKTDRRDSNSSAGYYHGISEWSERYQNQNMAEKHNLQVSNTSMNSYPENARSNGHQEAGRNPVDWTYSNSYGSSRHQHHELRNKIELQDTPEAPSPPLRRRAREQLLARQEEKNQNIGRVGSPVNVVQRTWENRSRAIQKEEFATRSDKIPSPKISGGSRSTSPIPAQPPPNQVTKAIPQPVNTRTPKATSNSKYKIGESFRKLVGKLRSASSERKTKRNNTASSVTQTDHTSTYLQYNVIDKNIPLVTQSDLENEPPERPPRSPKAAKAHWQQSNEGGPPVHRYYLGEDPFGGSIYGREMGYSGSKPTSRHHQQSSRQDAEPRVEPTSSIGRFSKSTSRLANEYDRNEQFRSTQTLPRKLHTQNRQPYASSSTLTRPRSNQRQQKSQSPPAITHSINNNRQYGSMINISIKNTVTSSKLAANNASPVPSKPERTYKSSLLRSKSFNVEANREANDPSVPYKSNLQLNRLDETPPLKSPGILASISRSNRDLFKAAKYEY
ncbi:uncharacterized protein LOC107218688 isoform X1 [Neodiprion lecontei]|uniref:Uncharacterized protein LOC107218688 isoform X1 n=2 Tax=Neodiprion lecontei TaxID=441921 RepID=A0ABM3G158_NEOLC|nr:uncharacterized protein LOC107218688 isoform X1 [Neodiprion lecontei]